MVCQCVTVGNHHILDLSDMNIQFIDRDARLTLFWPPFSSMYEKSIRNVQFQCRFLSNLKGLTAKEISGNKDK